MIFSKSGYNYAIQAGNMEVTRTMLDEQRRRLERINKEKEVLKVNLSQENLDKINRLEKIKNIESIYLRIMERKCK